MRRLFGILATIMTTVMGCSDSTTATTASLGLKVLEIRKTTFIDPIVADVPNLFVAVHVSLTNVSLNAAAPLNPTRFSVSTTAAVVYGAAPVETLQDSGACDPNVSVSLGGVSDCWVVFKLTESTAGTLSTITYKSLPPIYAPDARANLDVSNLSFAQKCETSSLGTYVGLTSSACGTCLTNLCSKERTAAEFLKNGCGSNAIYKCKTAPYCDCERAAFLTLQSGAPGTDCPGVYDPLQACLVANCARDCQL